MCVESLADFLTAQAEQILLLWGLGVEIKGASRTKKLIA
jgi:hypothetical protein